MKTENQTVNPIKAALIAALDARESMASELVHKGLAQRSRGGLDFRDTRHPRYQAWKSADSAYWRALYAAEEAGLIQVHTHSFSWVPESAAPRRPWFSTKGGL